MRRLEKIILIAAFTAFLVLVIADSVFAQRQLEVEYPEIEGIRLEDTSISLPNYVKYIFNFSLALAGLIVFIILIYAGFRYFTSAGDPAKIGDARNQIFAAFLGLVILSVSYLILTTINPQLILLKIPERVIFEREEIIDPQPTEKETLFYTEIPLGGLTEELFSRERMDRIKDISENIQKISKEIFDKTKELNSLTNRCACSLSSPQCVGQCSGAICVGDPCLTKEQINQKREEISDALSDSEELNGLKYWQKKLNVEINGSTMGEEKIIGFKQIYEDLKSAEKTIKNCPLSLSKKGESQILLGYNEFWQYRERLEEDREIEGVEPYYPFDYISSDNSYYLDTFYCAEIFYLVSAEPINIEKGEVTITTEQRRTICEPEILIGETIDNAEELARKLLNELDNIKNNALKEISAAQNLINLSNPENCVASNCYSDCTWIEKECWVSEPCGEEEEEEERDWWNPIFWMLKSPFVFAQGDCGYWEDCSYCEGPSPCAGSLCPGDPALKTKINTQFTKIRNSNSQIASSHEKVKNFIEEKAIEDKLKKLEIFKNLGVTQNQLSRCYNSKETQRKAFSGEKVLWKGLYSCSQLKEYLEWQVFYDERGQLITECYGSSQGEPDLFDNFLCCYYEL